MKRTFVLIGLVYPLLMFAGLKWFEPRTIAAMFGILALLRLVLGRRWFSVERQTVLLAALASLVILLVLAVTSNNARYLFALPVLINALLLLTFGASLLRPPSIVETFARLQVKELSAEEVAYCRAVTGTWCGFFTLNGGVIVWLSVTASPAQWTLYTGLISYLLIGGVFAVEFVYRHYRFRRYLGAPTDALFKKLFPPREAS